MLDCSRTFLSIGYLRHTIDLMALYKLNVLHLHLTDDQGWRLQMNEYPELTAVGSHLQSALEVAEDFIRSSRCAISSPMPAGETSTIVPEIEMPGHSQEVLAAYPQLACPSLEEERL